MVFGSNAVGDWVALRSPELRAIKKVVFLCILFGRTSIMLRHNREPRLERLGLRFGFSTERLLRIVGARRIRQVAGEVEAEVEDR